MKAITSFVLLALFSTTASATVNIDMVTVGNPGNAADKEIMLTDNTTGYGSVDHVYKIGKYEVTVGQYTAFLNAVAATDTYDLYNASMGTDLNIAGIAQIGTSGSFTYSAIGSPNHPIAYVSWGDAARFSNWLSNGQPTGPQNSTTTEDGAYSLNGATSSEALYAVTRNANAKWFIPTENEWYKAAYYQPAAQGGDSDNYWLMPVRTNALPYSDQPPGSTPDNTRVANIYENDGSPNGYNDGFAVTGLTSFSSSQNYLTDVGAYSLSPSFYGTFDQGGNVLEWNEAQLFGSQRGLRGGSWGLGNYLYSAYRYQSSASYESNYLGFRVASIPEPSTLLLHVVAVVGMALLHHRL